jgi:methylated-DNA-[protein]-cysteine S-methyltransferase
MTVIDFRPDSGLILAYPPGPGEVELLRRIASDGGFVLPPLRVRAGTMRVRFLGRRRASAPGNGFAERAGLRLVGQRRLTTARLRAELERQSSGLPSLTPRQAQAVLEAVRAGYYDVPRRSTVHVIAERMGLGRSTVEEHLRAAESVLVRGAAPLVKLLQEEHAREGRTEPAQHFARFSSELQMYVDLVLRSGRVARVRLLRSAPSVKARADHPYLAQVLEHLRTGRERLEEIPVELAVGPFERRVLEAIRRIPPGETRTYSEVARSVGNPRATRAVGNACAHNPAVVVVPCHRVLPAQGGVGRYSGTGGSETKLRLLLREGVKLPPGKPSPADDGPGRRARRSGRAPAE